MSLLQLGPLLGEVTMNSSMSEYTSFTANMSEYTQTQINTLTIHAVQSHSVQ